MKIRYKSGYKYVLKESYVYKDVQHGFPDCALLPFINIRGPKILIYWGYAWDGASGPAIDTDTIMRGSLMHDALYQLIETKKLPSHYKRAADKLLYKICREDGMWWLRAQWVYWACVWFGNPTS